MSESNLGSTISALALDTGDDAVIAAQEGAKSSEAAKKAILEQSIILEEIRFTELALTEAQANLILSLGWIGTEKKGEVQSEAYSEAQQSDVEPLKYKIRVLKDKLYDLRYSPGQHIAETSLNESLVHPMPLVTALAIAKTE